MVRESLHIKKEAFEAWRRVIEVTLASCPVDILPKDTRQTVISEVLQDLLSKVKVFFTISTLLFMCTCTTSGKIVLHRRPILELMQSIMKGEVTQ